VDVIYNLIRENLDNITILDPIAICNPLDILRLSTCNTCNASNSFLTQY